jgi:hypothetical protein
METGRMIAFVVGKILMSNLPLVVRLLPLLGVLAIASRASAQNAFAVNEDGQLRLVKEVRNGYPWTEVGGKLQPSYGGKFTLTKMPFYRSDYIFQVRRQDSPLEFDPRWGTRELRSADPGPGDL